MPEDQNPEQDMILSNQGNPFKTEAAARKIMTEKGLDHAKWKVASHEEGFAIVPKPAELPETYWVVRFNPRADASEEEDVVLTVNGDTIVCQRGVETIIPGRYRECADHTTIPKFEQLPNQSRKSVTSRMLYPYSVVRETTEAEYRKMLREGTKKTMESLKEASRLV